MLCSKPRCQKDFNSTIFSYTIHKVTSWVCGTHSLKLRMCRTGRGWGTWDPFPLWAWSSLGFDLQKRVFLKSSCKSRFLNNSVNLSFISVIAKYEYTDLWGSRHLQKDLKNTLCEIRLAHGPGRQYRCHLVISPIRTKNHKPRTEGRERVIYWQPTGPNPLHHRDGFSRPALRHRSLNSLFQVALYLPS